jgi:hypothetical protein
LSLVFKPNRQVLGENESASPSRQIKQSHIEMSGAYRPPESGRAFEAKYLPKFAAADDGSVFASQAIS